MLKYILDIVWNYDIDGLPQIEYIERSYLENLIKLSIENPKISILYDPNSKFICNVIKVSKEKFGRQVKYIDCNKEIPILHENKLLILDNIDKLEKYLNKEYKNFLIHLSRWININGHGAIIIVNSLEKYLDLLEFAKNKKNFNVINSDYFF